MLKDNAIEAFALSDNILSEHFRAIVASSDDAIISKTLSGRVTSWNPGAQTIFGYAACEIVGQPMLLLFPPDKMEEEGFILAKILAGEKVDHFETVRLHKDGRQINVSVSISPIRDLHGRIVGASKIARDISAQTRAEEKLKLTASVFSNTSEGILIADRQGVIVDVNAAFTRITGYRREEVMGQHPDMFHSSRQGPEVFLAMRLALLRQGEWKGEVWSRRKNGDTYSALITVSKVRATAGRVSNYVVLFSDVTALKLQQEKLEHGAHFDALTDLPNRLLLSDRLHQAMALCQRRKQSLAVLYLDLDGFKSINDQHGHAVGDELLIAVARRMRTVLRDVDTLARMGGDEFVAVLTDIESTQDCLPLVTRILRACAAPVHIQGMALKVSASIGVTLYPQDDAEADQLMRHADQAMYEAKLNGKNRFHLFDAAQDAEVRTRNKQQLQIARALQAQEFVLHFQPKVNIHTGALLGLEALIRWQHPDQGLLTPGAFLPAIEKHRLSEELGAWVLGAALQQMRAWQQLGLTLAVSVNVSARQLQQKHFAKDLAELLSEYPDVDAHLLALEVLETSALEDINSASTIMENCRKLGVCFALDDFGTGYSSLTYLRRLPVQTLKIDQSFVRDMLDDDDALAIVTGVIGLAAAFKKQVIAEGVETIAQGIKLIELGCESAQGYGIARPMPAHEVPGWLARWRPHAAWTGQAKNQ